MRGNGLAAPPPGSSNTHTLTKSEAGYGMIGVSRRDVFWDQFGEFDLVTDWGTAFGRRVHRRPNRSNVLWLGKTVTRRLGPGARFLFSRVDAGTVRLVLCGTAARRPSSDASAADLM